MAFKLPFKAPKPLEDGFYTIDNFNRNPIFAVNTLNKSQTSNLVFVRSWEEAFAIHGDANINDLNPAYIVNLLFSNPRIDLSPYKRIKRLPRSTHVFVKSNGNYDFYKYDAFSSGANIDSFSQLQEYLISTISSEIQNKISKYGLKIGIEHSSGIDSNSLLGIAAKGSLSNLNDIYTFSIENKNEIELIKKLIKFYNLKNENCFGIYPGEKELKEKISNSKKIIEKLGFMPFVGGLTDEYKIISNNNINLILSGLGGDQCISHDTHNLLINYVMANKIKNIICFKGSFLKGIKFYLKNKLDFRKRSFNPLGFSNFYNQRLKILSMILSNNAKNEFWPFLPKQFIDNHKTNLPIQNQ